MEGIENRMSGLKAVWLEALWEDIDNRMSLVEIVRLEERWQW